MTPTTKHHVPFGWRLLLVAIVLFGVLGSASYASATTKVVATIGDLGAIARAVGGDAVAVTVLAPADADPHYVDPRPSLVLELNKADLLLEAGLGLEAGWLPPLVTQARNKRILAGAPGRLVASEYASLLSGPSGDRSAGDIHPGGSPHFYTDPDSAISIARALAARLTQIDPDHAATYERNASGFAETVRAVSAKQRGRFAKLPAAKRRFVAYHESLGYIARWLELEQVATAEPKPGVPPSPAHVAKVLKVMKSMQTRVVIQEAYYPRKTSQTLAKLAKGSSVVIAGAAAETQTYEERLTAIADSIYAALTN